MIASQLTVNKLKTSRAWDEASKFDAEKDKAQFRLYEDACDRVKTFYKEQHGEASRYAGLAPDVELTPHGLQRSRLSNSTSGFGQTSRRPFVPVWVRANRVDPLRSY